MNSISERLSDLTALTAFDFDESNSQATGMERLDALCDKMIELDQPEKCIPFLFQTMERLDTVHLGSPGPIVHTLESWKGKYEPLLVESLGRKPVPSSVWMVNRILNSNPVDALFWLDVLRSVMIHPLASAETKAEAVEFLECQQH